MLQELVTSRFICKRTLLYPLTVPFESMRDVMRAYPDWKLQMMAGMQVFFIYKVQDGDPDYVKFWDRVLNMPDETTFVE